MRGCIHGKHNHIHVLFVWKETLGNHHFVLWYTFEFVDNSQEWAVLPSDCASSTTCLKEPTSIGTVLTGIQVAETIHLTLLHLIGRIECLMVSSRYSQGREHLSLSPSNTHTLDLELTQTAMHTTQVIDVTPTVVGVDVQPIRTYTHSRVPRMWTETSHCCWINGSATPNLPPCIHWNLPKLFFKHNLLALWQRTTLLVGQESQLLSKDLSARAARPLRSIRKNLGYPFGCPNLGEIQL